MKNINIVQEANVVIMQSRSGFKVIKHRHDPMKKFMNPTEAANLMRTVDKVLIVNARWGIITANFDVSGLMKSGQEQRYYVDQISRKDALDKLVNHHLQRNPQVSYAFGLFDRERNNRLVAVLTYGSPASPTLCKGLCGEEERRNVIELNRLWAETSVSNNALVYFISKSFEWVDKEIVVSFVQPEHDRVSRLFKLMGFYYTGLTTKSMMRVNKDGTPSPHHRHNCYNKTTTYLAPAPRKHRFVLFNATPNRKHELFEKLNYDVVPY